MTCGCGSFDRSHDGDLEDAASEAALSSTQLELSPPRAADAHAAPLQQQQQQQQRALRLPLQGPTGTDDTAIPLTAVFTSFKLANRATRLRKDI